MTPERKLFLKRLAAGVGGVLLVTAGIATIGAAALLSISGAGVPVSVALGFGAAASITAGLALFDYAKNGKFSKEWGFHKQSQAVPDLEMQQMPVAAMRKK